MRSDHQVTSKAVVVATGVIEDGRREILGLGLSGVHLVISDHHPGLVAAIRRYFQGARHQRCRVHFATNLLANIPKVSKRWSPLRSGRSSPR